MSPLKNVTQAADFLGISVHTLRDMITARRVPVTRIGKHYRFSDDDLAAIIAAGHQPAERGAA